MPNPVVLDGDPVLRQREIDPRDELTAAVDAELRHDRESCQHEDDPRDGFRDGLRTRVGERDGAPDCADVVVATAVQFAGERVQIKAGKPPEGVEASYRLW